METLAYKQRGISLVGMIMIAIAMIIVAIFGMKMIPPYVHNAQIAQIFRSIAGDPAMQEASLHEIKVAYGKRAGMNNITELTEDDLEISKEDGVLTMSARYSVKIPIAGNVSVVLEFNPSSS